MCESMKRWGRVRGGGSVNMHNVCEHVIVCDVRVCARVWGSFECAQGYVSVSQFVMY